MFFWQVDSRTCKDNKISFENVKKIFLCSWQSWFPCSYRQVEVQLSHNLCIYQKLQQNFPHLWEVGQATRNPIDYHFPSLPNMFCAEAGPPQELEVCLRNWSNDKFSFSRTDSSYAIPHLSHSSVSGSLVLVSVWIWTKNTNIARGTTDPGYWLLSL